MSADYQSFHNIHASRDGPNPLRPYYIPPSLGRNTIPDNVTPTNISSSGSGNTFGLGGSVSDLFSSLDPGRPFLDKDGPTLIEMGKKLMDQAIWKYSSVLLAQPFDVAKMILQVRLAEDEYSLAMSKSTENLAGSSQFDDNSIPDENESDEDSPSYFTPTRPVHTRFENGSPRRKRRTSDTSTTAPTPVKSGSESHSQHILRIKQHDSVLEVLASVWTYSGATGLWKATNATFVYNVLVKAVESWTRSLLCALANLPDPVGLSHGPSELVASAMGGVDVSDSPSPLISLAVAVVASAVAGLLLSPLDLVRTRLIMTPTTLQPRATLPLLRSLPSLFCPTSLLPITLLHSSLPTLFTSSTPLILRSQFRMDPFATPTTYSIISFLASSAELFLKLPLETILRRAQVSILQNQHIRQYKHAKATQLHSSSSNSSAKPTTSKHGVLDHQSLHLIVNPGPYKGVFGTVYSIIFEEGHRRPRSYNFNTTVPTSTISTAASSVAQTPVRPSHSQHLHYQRHKGHLSVSDINLIESQLKKKEQDGKKGQGVAGLWRGWRVGMWGLCGVWLAGAMGGLGGNTGGEF